MTDLDPFGGRVDEASLRESGRFPYSALSVRCGALVGVLLAMLFVCRPAVVVLTQHVLHTPNAPHVLIYSLLSTLASSILGIAAAGCIGAFLLGFSQTRGHINGGSLSLHFDRLSPFRMPPLRKIVDRLVLLVLSLVCGVPLVVGIWYLVFVLALGGWRDGVGELSYYVEGVFSYGIAFLALAGILGAVVSWWATSQRFRWKYLGENRSNG